MSALSSLRSMRGFQLALLIVATTSAYYARTALGPLQETIRISLSLTDNQMALLQGPALALGVIAAIPLGLWIDRGSRVRLLFVLAVLAVCASFLTARANAFLPLFLARCLIGLAASSIWATVLSLIADHYAPAQRGRATMAVAFGGLGGMSAAFAFGGALLGVAGASGDGGWQWAMLWLSVPLVAVAVVPLLMREPARTGLRVERPPIREVYAGLWRYRTMLVPLTVGFIIVGIADGAALIWAAPTFSRAFGLPPDRVGAIMAGILLVSGLLSPILGGALADLGQKSGGPRRTVTALTVLLFLTIPVGLFSVAPDVSSASVLLVIFIALGGAFNVAVQAVTTIIIPNELRGSCLSLMLAVSLIFAFGVAPVLVSQLANVTGGLDAIGRALAVVCVASSAVGAVTLYVGRRSFPTLSTLPER